MCERDPNAKPDIAAQRLAFELLHTVKRDHPFKGCFSIDPEALRKLIHDKWDRISTLTHAIHDAKPKEKTTREKLADAMTYTSGIQEMLDRIEVLEHMMKNLKYYYRLSSG